MPSTTYEVVESRPVDTASDAGSGTSTWKVTNQRPGASRETVTVDGSSVAGSMSGQDHTNRSGALVLARVSCPSRQRNAARV